MRRIDFFIMPFFMDLAVAVSGLMVNLRALDLGASALTIGVLLGACWGLPYVGVSLATGKTVGRLGARWTMVLGAAMFCVSVAGYGAAESAWILLASAPLGGAGSALFWPALQTCLPADTPEETRARSGVFNVSWTLGILVGGASGGHLYGLAGPRWSFLAVAILIGLEACLIAVRARPTAAPAPARSTRPELAARSDGGARALLLMARASNFAMWFLGAATGAVFPRIARALGLDDGSIGEISAAVWAGQALAFAWVSRGVWWQGRALPFAGALAAGIAAMCLLVWGANRADIVKSLPASMFVNWQAGFAAHAAAAFAAGFALVGIARALTHAASMHYSLSVGRSPEANLGYHEAIIGAAFVLGPLAAGLAADTLGVRAPFAVSAIVGIGALLLVLRRGARLRTAVI